MFYRIDINIQSRLPSYTSHTGFKEVESSPEQAQSGRGLSTPELVIDVLSPVDEGSQHLLELRPWVVPRIPGVLLWWIVTLDEG